MVIDQGVMHAVVLQDEHSDRGASCALNEMYAALREHFALGGLQIFAAATAKVRCGYFAT